MALPASREEWTGATLAELVDYILVTHHRYTWAELEFLDGLIAEAIESGDSVPLLEPLQRIFRHLRGKIECHLANEESRFFPAVIRLESHNYTGAVEAILDALEEEQGQVTLGFDRLRDITNQYTPPGDAGEAVGEIFRRLRALEEDLKIHAELETRILFPRAAQLEPRLR